MMRKEPVGPSKDALLTRISVSGGGQNYLVRNGNEQPMRLWALEDGLRCECGRSYCVHIASLEMCGFVEPAYQERRAA